MNKFVFALLTLIIASGVLLAQNKKPNVIIILSDDQGAIDLNCYGAKDLVTPNLDKLAKGGIRFTQFYAGSAVCSPSRAVLLTGKSSLGAGVPGNIPVPEYQKVKGKSGMPTEQVTIAEMLNNNGYYSALVGKWHLGHDKEKLPNAQGFNHFFGHERGCIDNYSHFFYWQGPNKHDLHRNDKEVYYPGQNFGDLMVNEIKELITKKDEKPFFIYWAFNAPHYPYQGTPEWLEYYKNMETPRKEYAAFVSSMDEKIGLVLDELEKQGKADNTIIIFQSDQGHSCEERAFFGGGNPGVYRGCKSSLFEGGIRVPAIIKYPGVVAKNETRTQLVSAMDWLPTIAELTGSQIIDKNIEGKSMVSVLESSTAPSSHEVINWQLGGSYDDNKGQWAVREGDWKLLRSPKDLFSKVKVGDDKLFLVNLKDDISEKKNLASQFPEKVKHLKALHSEWLKTVKK